MKTVVKIYLLGRKKEWRWKLLDARNRRIIGASSEGYKNRHAAIANLKRVTGILWCPKMKYGTKSIVWIIARDKHVNGITNYIDGITRN